MIAVGRQRVRNCRLGIQKLAVLLKVRDLQAVGALHGSVRRRLFAQQHAQQRRLAATVRTQQADARPRPDEQIDPREDRAPVVGLGDAARLDEPARPPLCPLKFEADRPRLVAGRQLVDLLRDVAVARDARLLLGRARGGAPAQPLRLAAQRVSQHDLAPLLRVHRLRLDARVGHVVAVDGQQPARVARVQLQDARRDPLQEQPIVRHRDGRRSVGARQQRLQPLDALDVQVVRRLVQQQQVGAPRQLAPQRDALLPAARQRRDRRFGRHGVAGASGQRQSRQDVVRRALGRPFLDGGANGRVVREPRHLLQQRHAQPALARHGRRDRANAGRPGSAAASTCPAPFGPMSPIRSPSDTVKLTPSNRGRTPNEAPSSCAVSRIAKRSPAFRA